MQLRRDRMGASGDRRLFVACLRQRKHGMLGTLLTSHSPLCSHMGPFSMATSPLNRFIGRSDVLARLQDHAARLQRLQRKLDAALPAVSRGAAQVANLQDGELILHVASPVMATRLKLGLETLKASLQAAGEPIQNIKIKVRTSPFEGNGREEEVQVRPIGAGGRAALQGLADDLQPDDPLARALKRMVERSAKG